MLLLEDKTATGNSPAHGYTLLYFHLTFTHHPSQERIQSTRVLRQLQIQYQVSCANNYFWRRLLPLS